MTLNDLSQLYYLNREIKMDQERLEALRARASSPSGLNLTGIPSGGSFENMLERYIAEIVDLENIIRTKRKKCMDERNSLERYIAEIPDSLTRQIFTLRFVEGLSWHNVAFGVGGGNTADSVRMICRRYIEQNN